MKNLSICLFLFFLSLKCFSQDLTISDCEEAVMIHGGQNRIDEKCFDLLKSDKDIEVIGELYTLVHSGKILWIQKKEETLKKVAGDQSQLDEVFDLFLDEKKEVAILFKNTPKGVEVLVHHLSSNGNVAPFIKQLFPALSSSMTYLYDQERSILLVQEKGINVTVLSFDWPEDLVRLGRAKIVELNTPYDIP